jgi:ADP-ribosylglycohydrolase
VLTKRNLGYTLKAFGAGFYALRSQDLVSSISKIVYEGGDADSNAAVAGALLGCLIGYHQLPQIWLGLRHTKYLESKALELCNLLSI